MYSSQLFKSLHFMMTSYSLTNRPGRWRAASIYVRNDETGEVVHDGPSVDEVPGLINALVGELNTPREEEDRIIKATMAHLNLEMIHPFRDGNGRMSRCLQSLALARDGLLGPVFMASRSTSEGTPGATTTSSQRSAAGRGDPNAMHGPGFGSP